MIPLFEYINKTRKSKYVDHIELGLTFDEVLNFLKETFKIKSVPRLGDAKSPAANKFFNHTYGEYRLGIITILKYDVIYLIFKDGGLMSFGFDTKTGGLYHVFYVGSGVTSHGEAEALEILQKEIDKL